MPWSPGPGAGFSTADPWLPPASDDPGLTVERQRDDPSSMLNLVRSAIALRRRTPALAVGWYRSLGAPAGVYSFERWHPDGAVRVHLNFVDEPRRVDLAGPGRILLSTARTAGEVEGSLTLAAFEGVVVADA
jgi:alpha-glucosidase